MRRTHASLAGLQAAIVAALLCCCIALGAEIPTLLVGSRSLVAVEPLLHALRVGYVIEGDQLDVDGRRYPNPLVDRDGMALADAGNFARFMHLTLTKSHGVLVFSPDPTAQPAPTASDADVDSMRSQLLDVLNSHRAEMGEDALTTDVTAQAAAQEQAEDMLAAGVMRHEDSQGRTPLERFTALGGHATWYGENVGWYQISADSGPTQWQAISDLDEEMMAEQPPDDGHRRTILDARYQAVGIGIAVGANGLYLAEDFVGR